MPARPSIRFIRILRIDVSLSTKAGHFHFSWLMHFRSGSLLLSPQCLAVLPSLQVLLEGDGIVMLAIMGAVDQRHPSLTRFRQKRLPDLFVFIKLPKVSSPELLPSRRIMMEPLPKCSARSDFFCPLLQLKRTLFHSSRPQPFDENTNTIFRRGWVINAFESNHAHLCPADAVWLAASVGDSGFRFALYSEGFEISLTPELIVKCSVKRSQHCSQSQKYTTARPGFFLQMAAGTSLHGSFGFLISNGKSCPSLA
jgi:hypothetical protein